MNAQDLLQLIQPSNSPKYSPNLHAWLRKWSRRYPQTAYGIPRIYKTEDGTLWIGYAIDCDKSLIGCRMISVLCQGTRAEIGNHIRVIDPPQVTDFWDRYIRDGRCAIDESHTAYFIGDNTRWKESPDGTVRECLWCGHHVQVKLDWTETITKTQWVAA